jgi:hypothetical protein
MPAPSQLAIHTSVLQRLVKEEASYHKELEQQEVRIAKLEQGGDDENAEYTLRQEVSPMEKFVARYPHKFVLQALIRQNQRHHRIDTQTDRCHWSSYSVKRQRRPRLSFRN